MFTWQMQTLLVCFNFTVVWSLFIFWEWVVFILEQDDSLCCAAFAQQLKLLVVLNELNSASFSLILRECFFNIWHHPISALSDLNFECDMSAFYMPLCERKQNVLMSKQAWLYSSSGIVLERNGFHDSRDVNGWNNKAGCHLKKFSLLSKN